MSRVLLLVLACLTPLAVDGSAAEGGTRLVVHEGGDAGTWVVGQYAFPAPVEIAIVRGTFRLVVEAPAEGAPVALVQKPSPTWLYGDESVFPEASEAPEVRSGTEGEPLVLEYAASYTTSGGDYDSLVFLAAANAPWTLDIVMDEVPGAGGDVGPTFASRGSGALFVEGADVGIDPTGVLQARALRVELPTAGWTHVHVETPWRPFAERNVTIRLPGATPMNERGAWLSTLGTDPPHGVEGAIEDYWDAWGTLAGPAGRATAFTQTFEPAAAPGRLWLAHLPDAQLPPGVGARVYHGSVDRIYWTDGSLIPSPV